MIVTHLDKNYLLWGKLLLLSVAKNAPNERVCISAANLSLKEIRWLYQFHHDVHVVNHKIVVPETIEYRRYMQCRITQVLLEAYHEYKDENELIIAMNADMLIRKPMDELYKKMRSHDVMLKFDIQHLQMDEIQNGVIVFNSDNINVLPFLTHYNSMWDDGKVIYRDDQRQLLKSFMKFKDILNFGHLPYDYIDGHFNKDSHMWSAHVHNRFVNYNKFLTELGLPEETICPHPKEWGVPC